MNVFRIKKFKRRPTGKPGRKRICRKVRYLRCKRNRRGIVRCRRVRRRLCKTRRGWKRFSKRRLWRRLRRRWLVRHKRRWFRMRPLGCVRDSRKRLLPKSFNRLNNNSRQNCARLCLKKGFRLFGLQYRKECFCSRKFSRKPKRIARYVKSTFSIMCALLS